MSILILVGVLAALFIAGVRILPEYERGVVFRLGRFIGIRTAGLRWIIPGIDRMVRIGLREIVMDVPSQEVITRDNVSVKVNAVLYFRVLHPEKAVIQVENYLYGTSQLAQTTLRSVCGQAELDELLSDRDRINLQLQEIIDLHQHTNYSGRNDERLLGHQKALGARWTILLPAGRLYGLAANCGGNKSVRRVAVKNPRNYVHFANEIADHPECIPTIESFLKKGAVGIGEQKFRVECDSRHIQRIAELAREYDVPVLMHFEHGNYNTGIERFHKILEKFPAVNFIGHAQTWWGNIDKEHDQAVMYPKGAVTPSGISDRLLRDYPNMFGDLSAGSGQNALVRDAAQRRTLNVTPSPSRESPRVTPSPEPAHADTAREQRCETTVGRRAIIMRWKHWGGRWRRG